MSKSHSGKFQNLEFGAPEAARLAAHRAGLSLNDWIDTVVAEKAEALGIDEFDLDEDARLDAVVERLTRLKLRNPRSDSLPSHRPQRRATKADSFATHRSLNASHPVQPAPKDDLSRLVEQLDSIGQPLARPETTNGSTSPHDGGNDGSVLMQALARLEARLSQQAASPMPGDQTLNKSLDARTHRPDDRSLTRSGAGRATSSPEDLNAEIARLVTDMKSIRRQKPNVEIGLLRQDLAKMARMVAELTPKRSIEELEGRLTGLLLKMRSSRDSFFARTVFKPVANLVAELRETIAKLALQDSPGAVARQISALSQKVAALEAKGYDAETFANLQHQAQHIYNMVQQIASRPDAFDAIEQRIAYLIEKIENIAAVPEPLRSEEVGDAIDQIRHLTERRLSANNIDSIERRIDDLSSKIDQVLNRSVPIPATPAARSADLLSLERMARQLENTVNDARQPAADNEAFAALQKQMGSILSQMDRSHSSLSVLNSIERSIKDLFHELESNRHISTEVADRAAQKAARETTREILEHLPQPVTVPQGEPLSRAFEDHPKSQDAGDQRAHETLVAVHDVLIRMTDRLAAIEHELAEVKDPPLAAKDNSPHALKQNIATAFARPYVSGATREAAPAPSLLEEDVLLEPRAGAHATHGIAIKSVDSDGDVQFPDLDKSSLHNDHATKAAFIAAARRAAQTAADSAQDHFDPRQDGLDDFDMPLNPVPSAGLMERVSAFAERRKRPLLLGLAAMIMVVLGMQFARTTGVNEADRIASPAASITLQPQSAPLAPQSGAERGAKPSVQDTIPPVQMISPSVNTPTQSIDNKPSPSPARTEPEPQSTKGSKQLPKGPSSLNDMSGSSSRFVKGVMAPNSRGFAMAKADKNAATAPLSERELGEGSDKAGALAQPTFPLSTNMVAQPKIETLPASLLASAQGGNAAAQYELGMRYLEGRGELRDFKLAASWFEKAANQGLAPAQYRIGAFYEKGMGVARDLARAKSYYERATKSGNPRAMHNLAVLTAEGVEGTADYNGAANWFRQASEYGIRDSQYNLAVLYARGLGVSQNLSQSYIWFALAAAQGDEDAGHKRDEVAAKMDAASVQTARAAVNSFHSRIADPAAVDVPTPAGGWESSPNKAAITSGNPLAADKAL